MTRAMRCYQPQHLRRVTTMVFKIIGLPPHSWLQTVAFRVSEKLFFKRQQRFARIAGIS